MMPSAKAVSPDEMEAMDRAGLKQTLKDLPATLLGSAIGYAIGNAATRAVLKRYGTPGAPEWTKHLPQAVGALPAVGVPLLQAKLNRVLRERREAARRTA